MSDVAKGSVSNSIVLSREYPRSPSSISPISSRRGSIRPTRPESDSEPPTPISPHPRSTRKRAASLDRDDLNHPRMENLALNTNGTVSNTTAGEKVCLCLPDPKIPRPRNAFILYRQHYQSQIVARHPGLANPEISKIIGEQWRQQPAEVKNEWKRLAEEEKLRHQRQYPDYRYQPRRAGAPSRNRSGPSSEDPIRCPKCGGRYISTPSTPMTPFTPKFKARQDRIPPPFTLFPPPGSQSRSVAMEDRAQFPPGAVNTPRTAPPHQQFYRRPQYPPQNSAGIQSSSPRDHGDDMEAVDSSSPGMKRRRFENVSSWHQSPIPYDHSNAKPARLIGPPGFLEDRGGQLPGPGALVRHAAGGMMEPPPRPSPAMRQYSGVLSPNNFDESLRLPPLQTKGGGQFAAGPANTNMHRRTDTQARSVEAMVMTIPYINKIKVLAKISPPLAPPGPLSPVQVTRGAVIAVEGAEAHHVAEVGNFLEQYMRRESDLSVKTWPITSDKATEQHSGSEVEMTGVETTSMDTQKTDNPFLTYLNTIQSWHEKSADIVRFITTVPTSGPSNMSTALHTEPAPGSVSSVSTLPGAPPGTQNTPPPGPKVPVALLPTGFSLSTSDKFSISIPINDAYAPVDHWQWMATLWRGLIGPDLTIYVKSVHLSDREAMDEMARWGAVECRQDCGAVIVRVPSETDNRANGESKNEQGRVEEKTLRRLGFEVVEMVRAGATGFGKRAGFGTV